MKDNRIGSVARRYLSLRQTGRQGHVPNDDLFPDVIFSHLSADLRLKLRLFLSGDWCEEKEIDCAEWDEAAGQLSP